MRIQIRKLAPLSLSAMAAILSAQAARAADNMNCTLIVPENPLSAQGLATPYQLVATTAADGPCHQADSNQSAFVQGAVLDPATGIISIYNPLVIDQGTQPAVAPVVPTLPPNAVVALWFGFQGNNLQLQGTTHTSLREGGCVNGDGLGLFGQFSYCNAAEFFSAANGAIAMGQLVVPPLGTGKDGFTCPSTRDFSVVDQDQSDNVNTTYLMTSAGTFAQNTAANRQALGTAAAGNNLAVLSNASDNGLLVLIDNALGCTPYTAPDLADPGSMVPALPLNELQAAAFQAAPQALVPLGDPMVVSTTGQADLDKMNFYREGVDQDPSINDDTAAYCLNMLTLGAPRIALDMSFTNTAASPVPTVGNTLYMFLASRFNASWGNLACQSLTGIAAPFTVTTDTNGVVTAATLAGMGVFPSPSPSATPCPSLSPLPMPSPTVSPSPTVTASPSATPSPTVTTSASPTPSPSTTASPTPSASPSPSPTASPSPSASPSETPQQAEQGVIVSILNWIQGLFD